MVPEAVLEVLEVVLEVGLFGVIFDHMYCSNKGVATGVDRG